MTGWQAVTGFYEVHIDHTIDDTNDNSIHTKRRTTGTPGLCGDQNNSGRYN
jgi:hypothetical protein